MLSKFTVNTASLHELSRLQFKNQPFAILVNVSTRGVPEGVPGVLGEAAVVAGTGAGAVVPGANVVAGIATVDVVTGAGTTGAFVVAGTGTTGAGATGAAVVPEAGGAVVTWLESQGNGGEVASTLIIHP